MFAACSRRQFVRTSLAAGAALAAANAGIATMAADAPLPKLKKAVKYGMIRPGSTVAEKLALAKKCGFAGVEVDSPGGPPREEAKRAVAETGVVIHGVIDSVHWRDTLSHADPAVRDKGRQALEGALDDAKFLGADTVLLVPGVVKEDVTFDLCWERSTAEVKKVLPRAEKLGVKIAVEVVWNNFLTTPEQLIKYVDQFASPWVGAYFDASNMLKYGVPAATWIRQLGKRMLKLDFKGYSHEKKWVAIGEGDEDWPEVLQACGEVGYHGWATAEVGGGDEQHLREISARMDKILGLA